MSITTLNKSATTVLLVNCGIILLVAFPNAVQPEILSARRNISSGVVYSSPEESNDTIWPYVLQKYSSSGQYLTSSDIVKLIQSSQKCSRPEEDTHHQESLDNPNSEDCEGMRFAKSDVKFDDITSLKEICPKILYWIDNPSCCDKKLIESTNIDEGISDQSSSLDGKKREKEKPTSGEVWGYGILCVTIISMSSLAGVSVMPFMKKDFYKNLLTALVGLAVGSLAGSAVFHLLPQAFALSENDPHHGYLNISLMICGGIWLFFMVERLLKIIMDYKDRKESNWKREKIASIVSSTPENSTISMLVENGHCNKSNHKEISLIRNGSTAYSGEPEVVYECQEQAIKASFGLQDKPRPSGCHDHSVTFEQGKDSVIATVAWMIIFGDGLHNFIDGLSIGAAFNESILTGVSISVAVLFEELPHELGDFAVLLNAGMSIRQALTYNFLSACTCYIGMGVGILLGEIEASTYIFALAGGMFLYIALVDMVPEMNEIAEETSKISIKKGMKVLALQNLGLFTGIATLFLLAKYQDSIQF